MAKGGGGKRQGSSRKPGLTNPRALARANPKLPDIQANHTARMSG